PRHGFGRPVADFARHAVSVKAIGFAVVNLRESAHAEIAEKFRFVEHAAQEAFHSVAAQQREQMSRAHAPFLPARDEFGEIRAIIEKPFETRGKAWKLFQQFRFERFNREQRDQSYHGADLQRHILSVRQIEYVIIKFFFVAPKTDALVAD